MKSKTPFKISAVLFMLALPAYAGTFTVNNSGATDYLIDGQPDPTLELVRGELYTFNITAPGHPFWVKTTPGRGTANAYSNGVTGNGTSSGILTFSVPMTAPDTLHYNCEFHAPMTGQINVIDPVPDTHYVRSSGSVPTVPYTNWATAAHTIQDAIDSTSDGDLVLVSNGVYATGGRVVASSALTNRVVIDKAIRVQSVTGPIHTVIQGRWDPATTNGDAAVRCVWMTNGASLVGFTLTNGATRMVTSDADGRGGGLYAPSGTITASNCVFTGNAAEDNGGGVYFRGSLNQCTLVGNTAGGSGGGAADINFLSAFLEHCTLIDNRAGILGGGTFGGVLNNCTLIGNRAVAGGGVTLGNQNNCVLMDNRASSDGGGAYEGTLINCVLVGNTAEQDAGGARRGLLTNCTVVDNTAGNSGGGVFDSILKNCIVYGNMASFDPNHSSFSDFSHSCTAPHPGGMGNITNEPMFVDLAATNFQLLASSPCRDTGNNADAPAGLDLDAKPRIVQGYIDMGAYEFQGGTAQGDFDGDGMGNGDEGIAGTDFTDANSLFEITSLELMSTTLLSFSSVVGRVYAADYNEGLTADPQVWTEFTNNISGTGASIDIIDPDKATNRNYRVRVGLP
jgi:parallel beta-helix repeat protein